MIPSRRILLSATPAWVLKGAAIDLDFANQRYYKGSPTGSLSISRASTGYAQSSAGVLTNFANDTLRITNQGLLIEEARTNLALQSQTFGTTWAALNVTVTSDAVAAPDGTVTADGIADNGVNAGHNVNQTFASGSSGSNYSASVYVKANASNFVFLNMQGSSAGNYVTAVYDLSAVSVSETSVGGTSGTIVSTSISALANGWYRITLVGSFTLTTWGFLIGLASAATGNTFGTFGGVTYAGASNRSVSIWGAQVELASFPTSYIPTTTVSVTRAADGITLAGGLQTLVANPPLSLVFKTPPNAAFVASTNGLIGYHSANNGIRGGVSTASAARFNSVTVSATIGGSGTYIANTVKTGASWDTASESIVANDGTVATGSNAPTTGATIDFGSMNGSNTYWNSYIARASFWNSRLPDATLKTFTV